MTELDQGPFGVLTTRTTYALIVAVPACFALQFKRVRRKRAETQDSWAGYQALCRSFR